MTSQIKNEKRNNFNCGPLAPKASVLQMSYTDSLINPYIQILPVFRSLMLNFKSCSPRDDLLHYIKTHYKGHRMVLAGAGGIAHEDLCKLATQHFGKISNVYENEVPKDVPCRYTGDLGQSILIASTLNPPCRTFHR